MTRRPVPRGGVVTLRYRQMAGTRRRRVPRLVPRTLIMVERGNEFTFLAVTLEPPIGIEPMTYALREARFRALGARPALMHCPGRSRCPDCPEFHPLPFHDPFHAEGQEWSRCVTRPGPTADTRQKHRPGRRVLLLAVWRPRSPAWPRPGAGLAFGSDPPVRGTRGRAHPGTVATHRK